MEKLLARVLTIVFLLLISSTSSASVLVENNFSRTEQTETLIAPWAQFGGATTTQQWSGLIEVIVSGDGIDNPPSGTRHDAFWGYWPNSPDPMLFTSDSFRLSFTGCATIMECGAPVLKSFIVFVDGVGFVDPPGSPAIPYSTSHTYRFVMDVGADPKFLTLGNGDGGVFDNSGQFNIQLFSVTPGSSFSSFSSRVEIRMNPDANDDKFEISGRFALGQGNNGINPLSEAVTIVVANVSKTIPAGSFKRNKEGVFRFEGVIDGSNLKMNIKPIRGGYEFVATGNGVNLTQSELPLIVGLAIGNDAGSILMAYTRLFAESD
jgi:hypothetical protein